MERLNGSNRNIPRKSIGYQVGFPEEVLKDRVKLFSSKEPASESA